MQVAPDVSRSRNGPGFAASPREPSPTQACPASRLRPMAFAALLPGGLDAGLQRGSFLREPLGDVTVKHREGPPLQLVLLQEPVPRGEDRNTSWTTASVVALLPQWSSA